MHDNWMDGGLVFALIALTVAALGVLIMLWLILT